MLKTQSEAEELIKAIVEAKLATENLISLVNTLDKKIADKFLENFEKGGEVIENKSDVEYVITQKVFKNSEEMLKSLNK
jgi:hypothetical protein